MTDSVKEAVELLIPIVTEGKKLGEANGEIYCEGTYMWAVETLITIAEDTEILQEKYKIACDTLDAAIKANNKMSVQLEKYSTEVDSLKLAEIFCAWPLPESVCADHCATIQGRKDRTGTNLLAFHEALQFFEDLKEKGIRIVRDKEGCK